jgi:hypothetical protein
MKRTLITVIVLIALMAAAKLHRHVLNAPQGPNMPVPEHDTEQKDEDMPPGPEQAAWDASPRAAGRPWVGRTLTHRRGPRGWSRPAHDRSDDT